MDPSVHILTVGDAQNAASALSDFLQKHSESFSFPELNENNTRDALWKSLYKLLVDPDQSELHQECLSAVRILSRDKANLNDVISEDWINVLLYHSELKGEKIKNDREAALEALKCLCNLIFNSNFARSIACTNNILELIIKRLTTYQESNVPIEIQFFDMKILFLITALCAKFRPILKDELHGFTCLVELIENTYDEGRHGFSDLQVNLSCEILKTLFNLCVGASYHDTEVNEKDQALNIRLVAIMRQLLLVKVQNTEKKIELVNHVVNLITIIPDDCFDVLILPVQDDEGQTMKRFEGHDMSAIYEMVEFLKSRFDKDPTVSAQHETLSPVLSALVKCSKNNRAMRKYLRHEILPPLTDVHNRPEEGGTIRNCLCRLLTTPITQVRDLTADFLFVLCKENIGRMIKYTGYGNAAGMFASRGLLGGKNGNTSNYSSDSEDSETEEYMEYKHGINPVVGCYQAPRPNPTADMTEEQKEFEAMKLVELMDNLTRTGIIKPCKIGRDGRPTPIEHMLQLQEGLPSQQVYVDDSD